MAKTTEMVEVALEMLVPYERNAKKHPQEQIDKLKKSIQEFGFISPCLIDRDNRIIAGHGRVEAARQIGMNVVPCVYVEGLTDEQRRAYILADNRLTELGGWDMDVVFEELTELDDLGFNIELTGFELPEEVPEVADDDFDENATNVDDRTKLGDIWQCGNHRLICGDSTDFNTAKRLLGDIKADLLLTDPPYNVDYEGKTADALKIQNDKMDNEAFKQFLTDAFSVADSVMKPGAAFYIWHADSEGLNFRMATNDVGWQTRECLVWVKNSMVLGRQDYQWRHEPCLYGWKSGAPHNWYADRSQTTVLEFDRPTRSKDHPTMKPMALFAYLIKNSSKKGDVVIDFFGGSGTTLIACEQLSRQCFMCELDPHYCDVIVGRWEQLTGRKAELINRE